MQSGTGHPKSLRQGSPAVAVVRQPMTLANRMESPSLWNIVSFLSWAKDASRFKNEETDADLGQRRLLRRE